MSCSHKERAQQVPFAGSASRRKTQKCSFTQTAWDEADVKWPLNNVIKDLMATDDIRVNVPRVHDISV